MRALAIVAVAVSLLVLPKEASGQCSSSSTAGPCSSLSVGNLDFRAQKDRPTKAVKPLSPPANPVPAVDAGVNPIDCGMIKPVDPRFKSAMPVLHPDPKVQLPTRIVQAPSCKR
jgi:hypothetical protein